MNEPTAPKTPDPCPACKGNKRVTVRGRKNGKNYKKNVVCMKCGPEALQW
jgi:hypothetical protein